MPRKKTSEVGVGYCRPPKANQFVPGKSGNPAGRPKGSKGLSAIFRDVISQKVEVTENGKTRRIPALEVMLRKLRNDAMRNDPRALRLILSLHDRYGEASRSEVSADDLDASDRAILSRYLRDKP